MIFTDVIGEVHHIGQVQRLGADGNFMKLIVIIKTVSNTPQFYPVDFINDAIKMTEELEEGRNTNIKCSIRGSMSKKKDDNRAFINLNAFKINED